MIDAAMLRELLHYDPETGVFTRAKDVVSWKGAISARAGDVAGCSRSSSGYWRISVEGKVYSAHRLAWLYVTGEWPPDCIDHINGDVSDNRFSNLRAATRAQNMQNRKHQSNNRSGFRGVMWHKATKKWLAKIQANGKSRHLGLFEKPEEAAAAYIAAAADLHGDFVRHELIASVRE